MICLILSVILHEIANSNKCRVFLLSLNMHARIDHGQLHHGRRMDACVHGGSVRIKRQAFCSWYMLAVPLASLQTALFAHQARLSSR